MGLKVLTLQLHRLLSCVNASSSSPVSLIDIGAGIHSLDEKYVYSADRLHPDDSDALWLLKGFGTQAMVHAFDISHEEIVKLKRAAKERPMTRDVASQLYVHHSGVGASAGVGRMDKCGLPNTYSLAHANDTEKKCRSKEVAITTMDAFARDELGGHAPLYVKVDTEGGEYAVLDGMPGLLKAGSVPLLSFEYAVKWDPLFSLNRGAPLNAEQREQVVHSLKRFTARLSDHGYDSYLINAPTWDAVTLVPIHGKFWRDEYEICANRTRFYYGHCWNDFLAVRRCSCAKRVLLDAILPASGMRRPRGGGGGGRLTPREEAAHAAKALEEARVRTARRFPQCHCL